MPAIFLKFVFNYLRPDDLAVWYSPVVFSVVGFALPSLRCKIDEGPPTLNNASQDAIRYVCAISLCVLDILSCL